MRRRAPAIALALAAGLVGCRSGDEDVASPTPPPPPLEAFAGFESAPVHPLALSADGRRLYLVHAPSAMLTVIELGADGLPRPGPPRGIPVGLEPVSLAERVPGEVWVVSRVSATVAVVDVAAGRVRRLLAVGPEPADVAFAAGRAFVAVAGDDRLDVFEDAADPREPPVAVPLDGRAPRALAVDAAGAIRAVALRSGNGTVSSPPDAAGLRSVVDGAHPRSGDLFRIDPRTLAVETLDGLGSALFDVAARPGAGTLWIPYTEARNRVRFEREGGLRGRPVDHGVAVVDPSGARPPRRLRLSAPPSGAGPAVAQPAALAWEPAGRGLWIAGIGSGAVFRLDAERATGEAGAEARDVVAFEEAVEVGPLPSGLALDAASGRLWVWTRGDAALSAIDLATRRIAARLVLDDPTPPELRPGRILFYDARRGSQAGDASCAVCHLFGDRDGLGWELGDPDAPLRPYDAAVRFVRPGPDGPETCAPADCAAREGFAGRKGAMATPGLAGATPPFHWRGDRARLTDFNRTFVELLGLPDLSGEEGSAPRGVAPERMQELARFIESLRPPPQPRRRSAGLWTDDAPPPDRALPIPWTAESGNPATGELIFRTARSTRGGPCVACHAAADGTSGGAPRALTDGAGARNNPGDFKIAALDDVHARRGAYALTHDGAFVDLLDFLAADGFHLTPQQRRDLAAWLALFPGGTPAAVGLQRLGPPPEARLLTIGDPARAEAVCAWIAAEPTAAGGSRGWALEAGRWRRIGADGRPRPESVDAAMLAAGSDGPVLWTCVPPGEGAARARRISWRGRPSS